MNQNNEYTLLDFDFSNGSKKLKLVLTYFNDVPKIDIREYYLDVADGTFKHSKKGVQLDPKKAEALRAALEQNAKIIDQHLLSDDLEKWATKIKKIETSADFFSHFEFFKTVSTGTKEEIVFNSNHPFGRKVLALEGKIKNDENAVELMSLIKCLLISYNHSLSQFDELTKTTVGDFVQDQNQSWSSLLKRITSTAK
jgi:hypothetical protein